MASGLFGKSCMFKIEMFQLETLTNRLFGILIQLEKTNLSCCQGYIGNVVVW